MNPLIAQRTPSQRILSNPTVKQRVRHQLQERKAKESLLPSFRVATQNNSRLRSSPRLNLYQRKPIVLPSSKTRLLRMMMRMIRLMIQTRTKLKLISSKSRKYLLLHRLARLSSYLKSLSNSFSSAKVILPNPAKVVDLQLQPML